MFKRLVGCVRGYWAATVATLLLIVGEAFIETQIPTITAKMVNQMKVGGEDMQEQIIRTGIQLIILALVSLAFGGIAGFTSAKASAGFAKNLRQDLFSKIQTFTFGSIDKFSSSSLVTRLTTDVANAQMSYMMVIRAAVRSPLMFVFSIVMAYRLGGFLSTTFVIVVPFLIAGLLLVARKAMPAFRRVFRKYDRLNESIEENVRAMRVVKGFSREDYEKKKFKAAADDICEDFTRAERIVAYNAPIMQICMYFNMIFILLVGSRMAISSAGKDLDVGQISAMLTYGMQILMSLMMLSMIYVILTISAESFKRIGEVLSEEPDMKIAENPITEVADGSIEFRDVNFKYSSEAQKYALFDIDLKIPSGSTVGIIGGTGSSKSTLVQLIPRLYDTTSGSVLVGGHDVREYDLTALRDSVSMVLQKNLLFSGTINENLRWGNPTATDEEITEVCRLAQADDFVRSFPEGYNTHIEQGGTNVSGGQKQRLCIARALLKRPKILILDDSTSAVDTRTDALIRAGFRQFIPETTKIIIAQRIASVQDADMIIVMDNGGISAVGRHDELLASSQIYREVYEQQTNGNGGEDNA